MSRKDTVAQSAFIAVVLAWLVNDRVRRYYRKDGRWMALL